MAWTNSKIFMALFEDLLENITAVDVDTDTHKAALYDNDITPDQTVTSANTAYNVGQWVTTGNECFEAGQWAQGGVALTSVTSARSSNVYTFDAADTASGAAADITNATGVLVYDDTITTPVADQGISFNYLGGPNSVVNGTFTVVWNASGIFAVTA
jgi:hypothetical protein